MYEAGVRDIKYFWLGNVLQSEYCAMDGYEIIYCYDENGSLIGFTYETSTSRTFYRYVMNLQGDVIALLDENYDVVVKYTYDTWGKVLSVTDANGTLITDTNHIGHRNPIRYRGYYYDIETELYYLQSRYYDPEIGRFISADEYISTGQGILGFNMYTYCGNNPVSRYDVSGRYYYDINDYVDVTFELNPECGTREYYFWLSHEKGVGYSKSFGEDKKDVNLYATINDFNGDYSIGASVGAKINIFDNFAISLEVGSDASIGIHGNGWNVDFGTNEMGHGYIQWTVKNEDVYYYEKLNFHVPQIVGTVLAAIYCPEVLGTVGTIILGCFELVIC